MLLASESWARAGHAGPTGNAAEEATSPVKDRVTFRNGAINTPGMFRMAYSTWLHLYSNLSRFHLQLQVQLYIYL